MVLELIQPAEMVEHDLGSSRTANRPHHLLDDKHIMDIDCVFLSECDALVRLHWLECGQFSWGWLGRPTEA